MSALPVVKTKLEILVATFLHSMIVSPNAECFKGKGLMRVPVLSFSCYEIEITCMREEVLAVKWPPQSLLNKKYIICFSVQPN